MNEKEKLNKLIEDWLPLIEGTGKYKAFVSSCPKIDERHILETATMFETIKQFGLEEAARKSLPLTEATLASAVGEYSPILIPMLRRIKPALLGPKLFGFQPTKTPTASIFSMNSEYQNTSDNSITGDNSQLFTLADASSFTVGGDITNTATAAEGVVRHIENNNMLVEITSGTFAVSDAVDNATPFSAGETTIAAIYDNEINFNLILSNYSGTYSTSAGEALSTDMKEIGFDVSTTPVELLIRKLKAKWTNEVEQDLRAVHGLNAENILANLAADTIAQEQNREFIDLIIANVGAVTSYDYTSVDGRWEGEKLQNLANMITRAKMQVAVLSKRGPATFMICSPAVVAFLSGSGKLDGSNVDPMQNVYVGKAFGMDVYVDLYAISDDIYLGYKGNSEFDAGLFYTPYIALTMRKGWGEEDGQPRTFFSTRYGVTENPFGATNYYYRISVSNIPT